MNIIQRIKSSHKRYVKRKRLGSFLALEINCAVLMMDIILLCCGCHLLTTCAFMFVVLLYNYGWFRCELDKYKDIVSHKREVKMLYKQESFWKEAFQAQRKISSGEGFGIKEIKSTSLAGLFLDEERAITFALRHGQTGNGIFDQITTKKDIQDESK